MIMQSNKMQVVDQLEDFIKKAEKLGKYPSNTAVGSLSALKIVADGLTDDEPSDINYITEHLEEIFHRQLSKLNLSPTSLRTYIARVRRVIDDFKVYGQDTKTLHAWKPKIMRRSVKGRTTPSEQLGDMSTIPSGHLRQQITSGPKNIDIKTLMWSLRPDLVIQIQLPIDLNKDDAARLKKLLDLEVELTPRKEE